MLKKIGCLTGTQQQWNRRDFVKVGSLGFLGMNLAQSLRLQAASSARLSSQAKAKGLHPAVARRRSGADGHLGSEDEQLVPPDFHQR